MAKNIRRIRHRVPIIRKGEENQLLQGGKEKSFPQIDFI